MSSDVNLFNYLEIHRYLMYHKDQTFFFGGGGGEGVMAMIIW